jgi:hypothetical protein
MNTLSEFIIRLLSPKPKKGERLVMPFVTKDQTGISKVRKPSIASDRLDAPVGDTITPPFTGVGEVTNSAPAFKESHKAGDIVQIPIEDANKVIDNFIERVNKPLPGQKSFLEEH